MSEHTQEHTGRRQRNAPAEHAAEQSAPASGNGEDTTASVELSAVDFKEPGGWSLTVDLPVKFRAGMVFTDHDGKVCQTAYERQFTNNINANAKARAERLAKAVAANDAAVIAANQPYTAADIAGLWATYQPAVGDTIRMSTAERMKQDATWAAWVELVGEHNTSVKAGTGPVITALGNASYDPDTIPTAARKDETKEAFAARRLEAIEKRQSFCAKMQTLPKHAERIQRHLDRLMAERGKDKDTSGTPSAPKVEAVNLLD